MSHTRPLINSQYLNEYTKQRRVERDLPNTKIILANNEFVYNVKRRKRIEEAMRTKKVEFTYQKGMFECKNV